MAKRKITPYSPPSTASGEMLAAVRGINSWRDQFNPMRGLTLARAVNLLEAGERGEYADVQWLYQAIEKSDPTLMALLERYNGGLVKLDWEIRVRKDLPAGFTDKDAEAQATALRSAYERIDNLTEVFAELVRAKFRGFALLEKWNAQQARQAAADHPNTFGHLANVQGEAEDIVHLEPVPQWFWVREGLNGEWKYNSRASSGTRQGRTIDYKNFLIRECPRPINRIGLVKFCYSNLGEKDWAGFIETFGIPPLFIEGPAGADKAKEREYQAVAEKIISDARGYLPSGAKVVTVGDVVRGTQPFKEYITHLQELVVLCGTGGKLTMLTESGSGTLAGSAHQDAWEEICEAEAALITSLFQRQFDAPILARLFEGEPCLAYFTLCVREEGDPSKISTDAAALSPAGYALDPEWLQEKTGYKLLEIADGVPHARYLAMTKAYGEAVRSGAIVPRVDDEAFFRKMAGFPGTESEARPAPAPTGFGGGPILNRSNRGATDKLVDNVMERITGVEARWLGAVRPFFEKLITTAKDQTLSEEQFRTTIEEARREIPELFNRLNTEALADLFERSMSAAMINGYVEGTLRRGNGRVVEVQR